MKNTLSFDKKDLVDMLRDSLQASGFQLTDATVKVEVVHLQGPNGGSTVVFQGIDVEVVRHS